MWTEPSDEQLLNLRMSASDSGGVAASEASAGGAATLPNKLTIALQVRAAMQEHRKGKPIAFQWPRGADGDQTE